MKKTLIRIACALIPSRKLRHAVRDFYIPQKKGNGTPLPPLEKKAPPPNVIPDHLLPQYSLDGKAEIFYSYINESAPKPIHITAEDYQTAISSMQSGTFSYYGNSFSFLRDAAENFTLKNKTVVVFGLVACNCDGFALWQGATKVTIVDYNKPICNNPKVTVLTHEEARGIKADIAISFSSFEHDGLGRYGDPLNPDGDLEAMKYMNACLKEDGIAFFSVPIGRDCTVWNLHRVYGRARLPKLLDGFTCLDVYGCGEFSGIFDDPTDKSPKAIFHPLLILSKEGTSATSKNKEAPTRNAALLREIQDMCGK